MFIMSILMLIIPLQAVRFIDDINSVDKFTGNFQSIYGQVSFYEHEVLK